MSSKNRIYTKSYFIKRLIDAKIPCNMLINTFSEDDIRKWSILIHPNNYNILCTCYKKDSENYWFKFDTEKKSNMHVKTQSMNIIVEFINNYIKENSKKPDIQYDDAYISTAVNPIKDIPIYDYTLSGCVLIDAIAISGNILAPGSTTAQNIVLSSGVQ